MKKVILVVDNIRSTHNVGSLLRTCDGLGVFHVYLCGITPYPRSGESDTRLPHIVERLQKDIHKTALGAEESQKWSYVQKTDEILKELKNDGWTIVALEQTNKSVPVTDYLVHTNTVLVVGTEVTGIDEPILKICDLAIDIPMKGKKESLNVSVAAAIALFWITK